ncbi:NACHT and WD repeat domain containing protein 2 [Dissostichus eleginoides]|uniref:NACHT and WD repeat domain containing protein 2 n=1 Tax=Dissostichus eleginoides TaxID=100907 RepID=A0AAD9BX04_DISEL|nr:NACHT and WD repeat domain containing protein 2 [Dissostichus eleginoides]
MWPSGVGSRQPCPRESALRKAAISGNINALPQHVPTGRSVRVFICANPDGPKALLKIDESKIRQTKFAGSSAHAAYDTKKEREEETGPVRIHYSDHLEDSENERTGGRKVGHNKKPWALTQTVQYDHCLYTEAERNALKEHVYPKLRDFCRENYGIEFQVVDLYWGTDPEEWDSPDLQRLRMKLLEECLKTSAGPCFVIVSGLP